MNPAPRFERYRMAARIAAVLIGYLIYRWVGDDRVGPGIMVGIGFVLISWPVIDSFFRPRDERLQLLEVGSAVLGLGLLGVGAYLALR
jgi:hypothetical protein